MAKKKNKVVEIIEEQNEENIEVQEDLIEDNEKVVEKQNEIVENIEEQKVDISHGLWRVALATPTMYTVERHYQKVTIKEKNNYFVGQQIYK